MKKAKLKGLYFISVFLLLMNLGNIAFNIEELSFLVPAIIVALGIGVIGVYLFSEDMKLYKNLHFISYVITVGFAFVPVVGVFIENGTRSYGFPTQWLNYLYTSGYASLNLLGFLFNYFIFYFILRYISKLILKFSQYGKLNEV